MILGKYSDLHFMETQMAGVVRRLTDRQGADPMRLVQAQAELAEIRRKLGKQTCECGEPAQIEMHSYAHNGALILLCGDCATQLARKLLEDVCELRTKGGRHG